MARRKSTPPQKLAHHWYLAEWSKRLGLKQKDFINHLNWSKAQASDLFKGKQRYTQDLIDEVATFLQLAPYELLMEPAEAQAIRDMRSIASRAGPVVFTNPAKAS